MICILYAIKDEVGDLYQRMTKVTTRAHRWYSLDTGMLNGVEIALVCSGAGKVLSSMTVQSIIESLHPTILILCGISGALNPSYDRGDMVIGESYLQHDLRTRALGFAAGEVPFTGIREINASERIISSLKQFSLSDARVHFGKILSGDQFIEGARGSELRAEFDADVVDMESAAVAFVCHLNGVPLVVARTISDRADHEAAGDFTEFLGVASRHVVRFVEFILERVECIK